MLTRAFPLPVSPLRSPDQTKMGLRLAVLALALSGVAAFVPSSVSRAPTQLAETKEVRSLEREPG